MVMFGTVQACIRNGSRVFALGLALMMSCVLGQAAENEFSSILAIEDVQDASLVTLAGGYEQGFRNGMKLLAHGEDGIIAELIVLDVTELYTQTLITKLFGTSPLYLGVPVTIKTINFAATWK